MVKGNGVSFAFFVFPDDDLRETNANFVPPVAAINEQASGDNGPETLVQNSAYHHKCFWTVDAIVGRVLQDCLPEPRQAGAQLKSLSRRRPSRLPAIGEQHS